MSHAIWGRWHLHHNARPYLVVDVRNIHNKVDIELEVVAHNSADDISANIVAGVSQMRIVVNSRATRVPQNLLAGGIDRDKGRLGLCQRVPHLQSRQLRVRAGRLPPWRLLT